MREILEIGDGSYWNIVKKMYEFLSLVLGIYKGNCVYIFNL